jgi:hypothetical protein
MVSKNSMDVYALMNDGRTTPAQRKRLEEAMVLQSKGNTGGAMQIINNVKKDASGKRKYNPSQQEIDKEVAKSYHSNTIANNIRWWNKGLGAVPTSAAYGATWLYEAAADWWSNRDRESEARETLIARKNKTEDDMEAAKKVQLQNWRSDPVVAVTEYYKDLKLSALDTDRRRSTMFAPTI